MATNDKLQRQILPIPDRKPVGLTTYDTTALCSPTRDVDHMIGAEERFQLAVARQ